MTINTGAMAKALKDVVSNWFGLDYAQYPQEWSQIFDMETSNDAFEEDMNFNGFEMGKLKPEGTPIQYASASQTFGKRYQMLTYALGYVVTWEAMQDNKYPKLMRGLTQALANSMKQAKETRAANVLNRAFNSSYTGADGVCMLSNAHLLSKGGTQSNKLATPADLSELSLEQMLIQVGGMTDDAGLIISAMGNKLIIPRQLEFEACRILKSELRNNTETNAINALKYSGKLPGGVVLNHYLTDTNAWFIKTNVPKGLKMYQRHALELANDTPEFDTNNMKFKAIERDAFGWTDYRGIVGSEGA